MKIVVAVLIVLVVAAVIQLRRVRNAAARQSRLIDRGADSVVQVRANRRGLGTRAFHAPAEQLTSRHRPGGASES